MRPFRSPRGFLLPLFVLSLFGMLAPTARAAKTGGTGEILDGVRDTGQFVPNATLLAKVGDRRISALDFRRAYFNADPRIRPDNDSLGRAEFLQNMIRKDVLGLTALASNLPLGFEDRSTLRQHLETLISNRLFEKEVLDIPPFSEDTLQTLYRFSNYEVRVRGLNYATREEAESTRQTLVRGRGKWADFAAMASRAGREDAGSWWKFESVPLDVAVRIWPLQPGSLSPVITGVLGYQVLQVVERRPRPMPAFSIMRPTLEEALKTYTSGGKRLAITREAKAGMDVAYDSTNVRWAAKQYFRVVQSDTARGATEIFIDERVPEFTPEDTARTLVRWKDGRLTLGQVAQAYANVPVMMRPAINTPELLMDFSDAVLLGPYMVELGRKHGLETDSVVVRQYERKREELLVMRMVEDSCFARIRVTPQERRDFYTKNRNHYVTYPEATVAFVVRDTREGADSVQARLASGESIESVLRADSLAGNARTGVKKLNTESRHPMHKLLFEEMRPGQQRVAGPDKDGDWACVRLMDFDPGRQLPFEEVVALADESVRNLKSEEALNAFVGRLSKRLPIESHFELVTRIRLTVPKDDETE